MANTPQARKRVLQNEKRRQVNKHQRTRFRTSVKLVIKAIRGGDKAAAEAAFRSAMPVIDGAVTKGVIHKNKAARHKSRLNNRLRAMEPRAD